MRECVMNDVKRKPSPGLDGDYVFTSEPLPPGSDPINDRIEFHFADGSSATVLPDGQVIGEFPVNTDSK